MAENKQEKQLSHLRELVKRNAGLDKQLDSLFSQYENLSSRTEQYDALLREFGLEETLTKRAGTKEFKMASMLYIDFDGFDDLTKCGDAQEQLDVLDEMMFYIIDIASKYKLIKIPTVGDNILLCGGIVKENKTNAIEASCAALEIAKWLKEFKAKKETIWNFGMGIHTGPVVGRYAMNKSLPYTLSGNNVLTVSRLGRAAARGEIVISPMTFELGKEFFVARECGKIPVKYSGSMEIFKLEDLREELKSGDEKKPWNEEFELRYSRIQFMDIQEFVLDMLEEKLPKNLYYHNVKHTIDVTTEVELIGWAEGLKESDIMLLKVAAVFHDSGFINVYSGHEEEGCKFVQEILPQYNYSQEKIDVIKRVIMATKLPHEPTDIMEMVIQDSDLDYLGRSDFIPVSNNLYKELTERGATMTMNEWNKTQIKFISGHRYYTKTAQSLREVNKQSQIERLQRLVEEESREKVEK